MGQCYPGGAALDCRLRRSRILCDTAAQYLPRDQAPSIWPRPSSAIAHSICGRPIQLSGTEAIAKVQTMMIDSGVMAPDKRVSYETVVEPRFAEQAKRSSQR